MRSPETRGSASFPRHYKRERKRGPESPRNAVGTPPWVALQVKTIPMTSNTAIPASGPSVSAFGCADADRGLRCLLFAALSQLLAPRLGLTLCFIVILAARYATSPWRKVPPGPKGLPVLGNVLQLKDKRWMFEKGCKRNFRMSNPSFADSCDTTSLPGRSQRILCI